MLYVVLCLCVCVCVCVSLCFGLLLSKCLYMRVIMLCNIVITHLFAARTYTPTHHLIALRICAVLCCVLCWMHHAFNVYKCYINIKSCLSCYCCCYSCCVLLLLLLWSLSKHVLPPQSGFSKRILELKRMNRNKKQRKLIYWQNNCSE